ncbi:hypothetical protein HG264_08070 [Pseudomonas sp. gcc21]|uniref:hypothetical protein n=1 Tax=Pseudomonas sp. gcc21 TaxID=2726989 RepID=UPI001451C4DE|nr:hypothetical protein [Pseudomonas sp. gcc21]QJD58869.1 hypothetical protein HG264_08070 [Pseudomonas sp. gcc21]
MGLSCYTSTSYSSAKLETQPSAKPGSGLKRLAGRRLPWGNTQKVVPEAFMRPEPETLRFWEKEYKRREHLKAEGIYKPKPMERIDFHDRCDHEHYRHAPWAKRSQFWLFLHPFGKVGFFLFLFLSIVVALLVTSLADADYLGAFVKAFKLMFTAFAVACLAAWLLASLVIHQFPRLWAKPSKGPKWELNRRTGMITVFEYRRRQVNEKPAPFHEFDAYITTTPDRQGLPMNVLSLEHRYSDISIHFGDLQPPDRNTEQLCALWDFIQNYMDTSHPLPDAPLFEEHRRNDPTTVEHDKATGRKKRFWIDMSEEPFKQEKSRMRSKVDAINTFSRRNLMAQHVNYPL